MNTSVWQIYRNGGPVFPYGYRLAILMISFGIWPVAPRHRAGVVWTVDDWRTANWTPAAWVSNVPNPFGGQNETWSVTLTSGPSQAPVHFYYALYVDDAQGVRHWDNNAGWNYEFIV